MDPWLRIEYGARSMSRLIDVSLPVSADLPVWPGDPAISIEPAKRIARGDAANVSLLALGNHAGTHVDPPSHFIDGGPSIDQLDPAILVGLACELMCLPLLVAGGDGAPARAFVRLPD